MPLLADIYAAVFNPLNWIFAFAPPRFSMNFVVLVSFEIGIAGAYRFARNLGLERLSASVTAIGFGFSGYLVMSLGQTPNLGTAVWLPWMLLAVEKLARHRTWRWTALGAVFLAWQFFSGLPQPFWYSSLTVAAYSLFAWRYRATVPRTFLLSLGVLFTSGVLLCGIQLLPLYQLQQQSWRAGLSYEEFAAYSLPIRQTVALLIPYFFGGATQWPFKLSYQGADGIFITCGYVGLLCWLFAVVAWFCHTSEQRKQVFFWSATAFVALCLAYGDNLPFGLNHVLYRLPVYNLFRASFRHQYEFGFALALLAGFGCEALRVASRQTLRRIFISFGALFGLLLSVFLWRQRVQFQWGLPELMLPVMFTSLSLTAAWWYAWHPQSAARLCLPLILFADLMAYGFGLPWRQYRFDVTTALQDPPAVQFIKQRERDLNAFRIVSHAAQPFQLEHALNYPNNSIVRGLASVNGYDMLQLSRTAHLLGAMTPDGLLTDQSVFNSAHRGLDLLNVKYLLREKTTPINAYDAVVYQSVPFQSVPLDLNLKQDKPSYETNLGGVWGDELALVTTLADSVQLPDETPILRVRFTPTEGRSFEQTLLAGRDTAEWAYDRAEVKASIRHRRAEVCDSFAGDASNSFTGHRYLARLRFPRAAIERIELSYVATQASLIVFRASLFDSITRQAFALKAMSLEANRWQKLASFEQVELYENRQALPRAWLVNNVVRLDAAAILQTVKTGWMPDGTPFDPRQLALVERPITYQSAGQASGLALGKVSVTDYRANEFTLTTESEAERFLVLAEIYYPGWQATIDGQPASVIRTNYQLRGLAIPSGKHEIKFCFRPASHWNGLWLSLAGSLELLLMSVVLKRRRN